MTVPNWYELVLLALAATRVWKLIGDDAILDRPRDWLLRTLRGELGKKAELLIVCPYCLGAWLSLAVWGTWQIWPHATLVASAPAAVSMLVGLVGSRANPG